MSNVYYDHIFGNKKIVFQGRVTVYALSCFISDFFGFILPFAGVHATALLSINNVRFFCKGNI